MKNQGKITATPIIWLELCMFVLYNKINSRKCSDIKILTLANAETIRKLNRMVRRDMKYKLQRKIMSEFSSIKLIANS